MTAHGPPEQAFVASRSSPRPCRFPEATVNTSPRSRGAPQQEALLQRQRQLLGEALPHKPLDHNPVAVPDKQHRLGGSEFLLLTDVPDKDGGDAHGVPPKRIRANCR